MSILTLAHTPKMMELAGRQIDSQDETGLVRKLQDIAAKHGAKGQAAFVMALCIVAEQRDGVGWLATGQVAHSISMQGAERFAQYGEKMYPFSERQLAAVARAVLQTADQPQY